MDESSLEQKYFEQKVNMIKLEDKSLRRREKLLSNPVESIDLEKIKDVVRLVRSWGKTSIQGRCIYACAKVYENMLKDPDRPIIFLGLSGPLIAGGLRKVVRDMIEYGIVDVIVSTGAILYQDFYNSQGYKHYQGSPQSNDAKLRELFIDRIYDTYVDEIGFLKVDSLIAEIASQLKPKKYSTREFLNVLGSYANDAQSILYTAYKHGVPIFCPAIADSSIGISLTALYKKAKEEGREVLTIDVIRDNYEISQIVLKSKKTAAIYIGGGVPKNYINDAAIMLSYTKGHSYAFQITTDSPHWGGLTGSTLSEARSWGKLSKRVKSATAYVEATVALPLIVGYILQSGVWRSRKRVKFVWKDDELISLQ